MNNGAARLAVVGWLAGLGTALLACSGRVETDGAVVRDSAGITIVENFAPAWSEEDRWRLSAQPMVTIGVEEGPEEYQLFRVRSALRLDDGRLVVANAGTNELRFYDPHGQFLFARGGDGAGPGEFRSMGMMWALADSLFIYDFGLARISVYASSGEFGRSFQIGTTPDGAIPLPWGVFSDRHLLVLRAARDDELHLGFYRDTSLYLRYDLEGMHVDTVGRFAGSERYVGHQGELTYSTSAPFGRSSSVVAVGDRLFFGSSDVYEIAVCTETGRLQRLIRRPVTNAPITQEEKDEYQATLNERMARAQPLWRNLLAQVALPQTKPAYGRVLIGDDGTLWVAEFDDERSWSVFDAEGRFLGVVRVPEEGRVAQIGRDYILGVWRDAMEIERVHLYGLVKP